MAVASHLGESAAVHLLTGSRGQKSVFVVFLIWSLLCSLQKCLTLRPTTYWPHQLFLPMLSMLKGNILNVLRSQSAVCWPGESSGLWKKKKEKKGTVPCSFHSPAHVQSMAIPQSAAQASHLFFFCFLWAMRSHREKRRGPRCPSKDSTTLIISSHWVSGPHTFIYCSIPPAEFSAHKGWTKPVNPTMSNGGANAC